MGLTKKIEKWTFPPFRGGKSLVQRVKGDERLAPFAGHPAQAMGPKRKELNRQGGLRFESSGRIAQPMFGDAADRTKCIGQFAGNIGRAAAFRTCEIAGQ